MSPWMGAAMQSCINSISSGICFISQSFIAHTFYMNPGEIEQNNAGPDVSRRGLTCLSCLHRHTQSISLASGYFREVTTPFDILLPGCFVKHVITENLLEKSACKPEHFSCKKRKTRAERREETETRYSFTWLQSTDIKNKHQENLGYVGLRVVFMLKFCITSF